ncbi:redox-sensing transcriptional repressor [Anaerobacterium chartisolvens]|uniref:Redox-sensing transcriptional repressor Rex n=1 Tax=Anaerobacterium chartisolvens TaxID=1297424 RepID=A0A369AV43_9FIRM|nr:redox-sensing transcriptional repressor Rex [Anaerobacterium chartisolvens]RCX13252.1 redox-sensing transcriptional repressor [Anaerobacterium chartisolvens]
MSLKKKVSMAVVRRLPRYYRYLADLLKLDITRISSKELSMRMGITASQIRQDLNCFGGFGQQGYGYNVEFLYNEIGNIMGLNNRYQTIIIGSGHMGKALANYENFEKRGFKLVGIFDINPEVVGGSIKDIQIYHIDTLEEYVKTERVDIAILSVPYEQTPLVADRVARLGIKGLWNFSPMDLKLPYGDIVIENVHLSDGLMVLGYNMNQKMLSSKKTGD